MKWQFDGIALTPKWCRDCHKHFIFERYKTVWVEVAPMCGGEEYICHDCYEKYRKDK